MMKQSIRQNKNYQSYTLRNQNSPSPQKKAKTSNIRVLRTNLVYAIGLWPEICSETILSNDKYFGKYGKVLKIAINKKANVDRKGLRAPTYSAVITYEDQKSASLAVVSLFEFKNQAGIIRCCYGCTKYCDIFFAGKSCNKSNCPYMHEYDQQKEIHLFNDQKYQDYDFQNHLNMASDLIFDHMEDIIEQFKNSTSPLSIFPDPYQSMQILIDNGYLTKSEYHNKWQQPSNQNSNTSQQKALSNKLSNSSSDSIQNQQQIQELDFQQSICNKIINKIHKKNKMTSILQFAKNKPTSPRFIEQFRSFFEQREIKQQ